MNIRYFAYFIMLLLLAPDHSLHAMHKRKRSHDMNCSHKKFFTEEKHSQNNANNVNNIIDDVYMETPTEEDDETFKSIQSVAFLNPTSLATFSVENQQLIGQMKQLYEQFQTNCKSFSSQLGEEEWAQISTLNIKIIDNLIKLYLQVNPTRTASGIVTSTEIFNFLSSITN